MNMREAYVIGLDFGTDSVRAVAVDALDGTILAQEVAPYPRWSKGLFCDAKARRFRQHPRDYIETLETVTRAVVARLGPRAGLVKGISVDTTGSTPVFVDRAARPLGLERGFEDDPDAMFILWKDHTSIAEAADINRAAAAFAESPEGGEFGDVTRYVGGIYSSEWFWAKALRVVRRNAAVSRAAYTVVEHCDWIPALLTGVNDAAKILRGRCAAGHKGMWNAAFSGYPPAAFFNLLHPRLGEIAATLGDATWTSATPAGVLSAEWASRLGLPSDCVVGIGAFDCHMGAVGGDIRPYQLVKVMGTSTCDILITPKPDREVLVAGICGQVDGSVVPGMVGFEAGQSAFGDAYAWFRDLLLWPLERLLPGIAAGAPETDGLVEKVHDALIPALEAEAGNVDPLESGVLALDWLNGRRTPDADQSVSGALVGLNLGTDAPRIYRAIVEATAYGSKAIVDRFLEKGIPVEGVIAIGGVSRKSELVMQICADVLDLPISVSSADQAVALGASMFAAVAGGVYDTVEEAQRAMSNGFDRIYRPRPAQARMYRVLYERYRALGMFEQTRDREVHGEA